MLKMTTMQKLVCFTLLLSLFPIGIGSYAVNSLSKLSDDIDILYNRHMDGLDNSRFLNIRLLRCIREEKNIILSDSIEEINKFISALNDEQKGIDKIIKLLSSNFATPAGKAHFDNLVNAVNEWRKVHEEVIMLGKTTDPEMNQKAQALSSSVANDKAQKLAQVVQGVADYKLRAYP